MRDGHRLIGMIQPDSAHEAARAKPYVPSGFRPQYELTKLYEELKGSATEERAQELLKICEKADGKLTIAFIAQEREALTKPADVAQPVEKAAVQEPPYASSPESRPDFVLFTPGVTDYDKAMKDNSAEPARCMTVNAADHAIGMLVCPAGRLTFGHRKFLRNAGFDDVTIRASGEEIREAAGDRAGNSGRPTCPSSPSELRRQWNCPSNVPTGSCRNIR